MSPSEAAMRKRIATLVSEIMNDRALTYADVGLRGSTLGAILHEKSDFKSSTLVRLADALNCDVVVNFRERAQ